MKNPLFIGFFSLDFTMDEGAWGSCKAGVSATAGALGCLIPAAVCVLILWVSPYAIGRYDLPQFYTLPLVMGIGSRRALTNSMNI